jgi:hypothetical protein
MLLISGSDYIQLWRCQTMPLIEDLVVPSITTDERGQMVPLIEDFIVPSITTDERGQVCLPSAKAAAVIRHSPHFKVRGQPVKVSEAYWSLKVADRHLVGVPSLRKCDQVYWAVSVCYSPF